MNRHQFVARHPMSRARVQGCCVWAVSISLLLLGALLVMALRVVPSPMEYLTIKDLITRVAAEYDPRSKSVTGARVRLTKLLNQIKFMTSALMTSRFTESGMPLSSTRTMRSVP